MSHTLEPAICGVHSAPYNPEALPFNQLAEAVIFGKKNLLMKPAQFPKSLAIPKHEHPRRERTV